MDTGHRAPRGRPHPSLSRSEDGFALIVAILALVGLTVLGTAGFVLAHSDYRVADNHAGSVRAFYAASGGLQDYLGSRRGVPEDTLEMTIGGDAARIFATELGEPDSLQRLVLLTSEGVHRPGRGGRAVRRVHTVALLDLATFTVPGALSSGVGIYKNGGSGEISGHDLATETDCPQGGQASRAGAVVPPGEYHQDGGEPVPQGDPPILEQDPIEMLEGTNIDWAGIVDGSAIDPDYTIPPDSWPNFDAMSKEEWPIIYVDGSFSVGPEHSGQGTLIVRNSLTMSGSFHWDGVVLVGGSLTSDGNQSVHGGTVTGFNLLLGESVPDADLGNGTKHFRFHSCHTLAAAARWATLAVKPGTWFETM